MKRKAGKQCALMEWDGTIREKQNGKEQQEGIQALPKHVRGNSGIKFLSVECLLSPQSPEAYGFTDWDIIQEVIDRQKLRSIFEQLLPCSINNGWIYAHSCLKCKNAQWRIAIGDTQHISVLHRVLSKNSIEMIVKNINEVFRWNIKRNEYEN